MAAGLSHAEAVLWEGGSDSSCQRRWGDELMWQGSGAQITLHPPPLGLQKARGGSLSVFMGTQLGSLQRERWPFNFFIYLFIYLIGSLVANFKAFDISCTESQPVWQQPGSCHTCTLPPWFSSGSGLIITGVLGLSKRPETGLFSFWTWLIQPSLWSCSSWI